MAVNNITNVATQAETEAEKLRKQNTQLPYTQATNQTQPVTLTPNAGQAQPLQQVQLQPMAQQVPQNQALNTATQVSTQQATQPSAMQQLINQKATDLMNNPTQGFDQNAYKQGQLSSYDLQNAQMYEALRQKNAGIANSGIWQSESLQNQVDSLRKRGELERKIDYENRDFNIESAINAMTQGLKAEGQSQSTIDNAVKNLVSTYEAQNPERTALIGAQSAKELQHSEQTYGALQADLNRKNELALQSNDINAVRNNLLIQIEADKQAQASGQVFTAEQNAMNRLLETSLKTMDIDSARALVELKGKIDSGMMLQEQDWTSAENELGRLHDLAVQQGDIKGQKEIEALRGEIDMAKQKTQQDWQTAERVSSQIYNTNERIDQNSADLAMKKFELDGQKSMQMQDYYNKLDMQSKEFNQEQTMAKVTADLQEAQSKNDYVRTEALTKLQSALQAGLQDDAQAATKELAEIEANTQKYLQSENAALQLKMQTQEFSQQEKMAYLQSQLEEAKANGDVGRQKEIIKFQTGEKLAEMAVQNGYDAAMETLKGDINTALQNNDFVHADALQESRLKLEVEKMAQDKFFQQASLDLQTRGVDMQEVNNQYAQIQSLVDQNILPESALMEFATSTLSKNGVDTSSYQMVDKQKAAEQALQQEYELQKKQFTITHPEMCGDSVMTFKDPQNVRPFIQEIVNDPNSNISEQFVTNLLSGVFQFSVDQLESYGLSNDQISTLFNLNNTGTRLSSNGQKAMNEFINSTLYGEETTAQKEAKANAGFLSASDIPMAESGQKFNITDSTTIKDAYGNAISLPSGKYYTESKTNTYGNSLTGKTSVTNLYLYDENGNTVAKLKQNTKKGDAGWKTMADPVLGIFEGF